GKQSANTAPPRLRLQPQKGLSIHLHKQEFAKFVYVVIAFVFLFSFAPILFSTLGNQSTQLAAQEHEARLAEHRAFVAPYASAETLEIRLQSGETLRDALIRLGTSEPDADSAVSAFGELANPLSLEPSREILVSLKR